MGQLQSAIKPSPLISTHNHYYLMASIKLVILSILSIFTLSLDNIDQMLLTNSLIVGRTEDLIHWICAVCNDSNKPIHSHYIEESLKDIKCVLSVYNNYVVLAFRYTNTALNVWQDILYPLQIEDDNTCKGCKVQKVYNNMWETIRANVTNDLVLIQRQTGHKTLYITGISLGGGLAAISFIDIRVENIYQKIHVTTFGAPMVGNQKWAAFFEGVTNGRSYRFIVKGDPIVVLPSCLTVLCNYKQTGVQVVCVEADKVCRVSSAGVETRREKLEWKTKDVDPSMKDLESIVDHIDGYPKIYDFTVEGKPAYD